MSSSQPKYSYAYIIIETNNVNHTALYTAGEKTGKMATDSFRRLYLSPGGQGKDLKSREHDEVISRAVPTLDLNVTFREFSTKRTIRRFAVIYKRTNIMDPDLVVGSIKELQDFFKHFRRHPSDVIVRYISNISDLEMSLDLLP